MMLLALALTITAALVFYLTCSQQNWRRAPWPRPLRWVALAAGAAATVLWCEATGLGAGISAALTAAMLAWTLAPYAGWWWDVRVRRGERP